MASSVTSDNDDDFDIRAHRLLGHRAPITTGRHVTTIKRYVYAENTDDNDGERVGDGTEHE